MEQDHNETDDGKAELDSTLPPLTKWERIEKTSEAFPLNNGHRGQIINNYLIVHGGFSGVYTNATWMLNLDTYEWHPFYGFGVVNPPEFAGRQWHSVEKYNNRLYTYGGATDGAPNQFGDVFEFDPATCRWQEIRFVTNGENSALPTPRYVHSAAVYKKGMYIYGGKMDGDNVPQTLGDLWRFDLDTRQWTLLKPTGSIPQARRAHMGAVFENKMYIFGGWNGTDHFNDMHYYHFKKNCWREVKQKGDIPSPRQLHTSVICGGKMYMVAGKETTQEDPFNSKYTGDLYEFTFSTSTWKKIPVAGSESIARGGHMAFEYNNFLFILGGYDGTRMSSLWRLKLPEAEIHEKIKDLSSRLKSDLRTIYRSKQYSDITVQINDRTYHFHSTLLSVRSPALLSLIQNEKFAQENISQKQMDILIEFIYEDEFRSRPIYVTEMADMHNLAVRLELPYLASLIENAVADILDPENLVEALTAFPTPHIHKRIWEIYEQLNELSPPRVLTFPADAIKEVKDPLLAPPRSNFSENLLELFRTGACSDMTILVNEEQFKLHQFILYQRCPYFKGFSEFTQRTSGSALVHKPQMPLTAFKSLLQYVYSAKLSCVNSEDYFWLLQEGSFYVIDDKFFYNKLVKLISKQITFETANHLLHLADKFNFNGIEEIKQAIRSVLNRS